MKLTVGNNSINLNRPVIMTIINVTPDSFYAGSRTEQNDGILRRAADALEQGAAILDIGGYSSRPGAAEVAQTEELDRLRRALEVIRGRFPEAVVSIDTFRAAVAETVIWEYGPCIINDITGGEADPRMMNVAGTCKVPYIAMHMRGMPENMQEFTQYTDIATDIRDYFTTKIKQLHAAGVEEIILDPGFGFSKTTEQNYHLLKRMHTLTKAGYPLLAGISRKSMICKVLGTTPAQALNGTTALHWECLRQGASILRVHDTAEAAQVIQLFNAFSDE